VARYPSRYPRAYASRYWSPLSLPEEPLHQACSSFSGNSPRTGTRIPRRYPRKYSASLDSEVPILWSMRENNASYSFLSTPSPPFRSVSSNQGVFRHFRAEISGNIKAVPSSTLKRKKGCGSGIRNPLEFMVGMTGFEPATPWSRTRCSTRLSHIPMERAMVPTAYRAVNM
jgi:hypothetical protein